MTRYVVTFSLVAGTHRVGLAFLNDLYAAPDDRNAAFDSLTISPPVPPRLADIFVPPDQSAILLQWETAPGASYEVQTTATIDPAHWQPAQTVTSLGNTASWADLLGLAAPPPRFYRLKQIDP
jgi:hypothetical protein